MKPFTTFSILAASSLLLTACGDSESVEQTSAPADSHAHADGTTHTDPAPTTEPEVQAAKPEANPDEKNATETSTPADVHVHADGSTHDDHAAPQEAVTNLAPDESSLGTVTIDGMKITLVQGHGPLAAGHESHLIVKLPHNDAGATVVRAWIGTSDATLSMVGMGQYNMATDAYDIHAAAPKPLSAGAMWWIAIEKPDGSKAVGSAKPTMN